MSSGSVIMDFSGRYRWLSNFYGSVIEMNGGVYHPVEACFQAHKTVEPGLREPFFEMTASEAKRAGRLLPLREDWEQIKESIMYIALRKKFDKEDHPRLASRLLETEDRLLVEENTWGDTYWGVCGGRGQNRLGYLLMEVRAEL